MEWPLQPPAPHTLLSWLFVRRSCRVFTQRGATGPKAKAAAVTDSFIPALIPQFLHDSEGLTSAPLPSLDATVTADTVQSAWATPSLRATVRLCCWNKRPPFAPDQAPQLCPSPCARSGSGSHPTGPGRSSTCQRLLVILPHGDEVPEARVELLHDGLEESREETALLAEVTLVTPKGPNTAVPGTPPGGRDHKCSRWASRVQIPAMPLINVPGKMTFLSLSFHICTKGMRRNPAAGVFAD